MDGQSALAPLDPVAEPSPEPPAHPAGGRWARAGLAALTVNLRCLAILTALSVLLLIVAAVLDINQITFEAYVLALAWGVHLAALVVVGYPLGVLTSRLLPAQPSLVAATATFAAVGGVSGALLTIHFGGAAQLAWLALGAVTAGAARAWAHRTIRAES